LFHATIETPDSEGKSRRSLEGHHQLKSPKLEQKERYLAEDKDWKQQRMKTECWQMISPCELSHFYSWWDFGKGGILRVLRMAQTNIRQSRYTC